MDANFAAGLWKGSTSYVEDAWNTGQLPSTETTVTYKLGEGAKISYVDSWVLFSSVDMKDVDPFTVTITSVVFSRADK